MATRIPVKSCIQYIVGCHLHTQYTHTYGIRSILCYILNPKAIHFYMKYYTIPERFEQVRCIHFGRCALFTHRYPLNGTRLYSGQRYHYIRQVVLLAPHGSSSSSAGRRYAFVLLDQTCTTVPCSMHQRSLKNIYVSKITINLEWEKIKRPHLTAIYNLLVCFAGKGIDYNMSVVLDLCTGNSKINIYNFVFHSYKSWI